MLLLKLSIAWYAWFQITSSLLSPTVFLALAKIQSQRAQATANLMNWRARNQLNQALAKSKANLPGLGYPNFSAQRNPLAAFSNPLIRTTRETKPDVSFVPDVQEVTLGDDFGDKPMDMLVPMDQDGELSSSHRLEPEHSSSTGRAAEPEPHLHIHKHNIHYHLDDNPYQQIHTPAYTPYRQPLHPGAYPLHQNFPPYSTHDLHTPQYTLPSTSHSSVQHQGINLNFVQNQHLGAKDGFQTFNDGKGHHGNHGPAPYLGDRHDFSRSSQSEEVLRNGKDMERWIDSEQEKRDAHEGTLEEIESGIDNRANRDETVGTFNLFNLDTPSYPPYQDPYHFDVSQPENRKAIVEYIEEENKKLDKIIQSLNKNSYHYNAPSHSPEQYPTIIHADVPEYGYGSGEEDYRRSSGSGHKKMDVDKIGAINTAELNQSPTISSGSDQALPDLSHWASSQPSSQPMSLEERQEMITDYFETEQKNVQMAMEELQKEHQRNYEILLRNLNGNSERSSERASTRGKPLGSTNYLENDAEVHNDEILTKLLQNDPGIEHITGISPVVGHIIQVPERRYFGDYYRRHSRSVRDDETGRLETVLRMQRNLLDDIEKNAEQDEDLKMIGHIGESIVDDIQSRIDGKTREKRATRRKDVARLIADPEQRFDMPKTLENLGAVARTSFEDEHAPMYHMRNMVGSARDAVVASMKIPNQNFLVPTQYDIVQNGQDSSLGDISPEIFSRSGLPSGSNAPIDEVMHTFQKVGSVIRGTVESGKEALSHVGAAANHAKNVIYSTQHTVPRVISKSIPQILKQSRKKTMIITPRIFDFSKDDQLQKTSGNRQDNFVRVGNILDAVGVSEPNPSLNFEKITFKPRHNFLDEEEMMPSDDGENSPELGNIQVEDIDDVEHDPDFVGSTLNSLQQVQNSVGANSLKDFILRMKSQLKTVLKNAKARTVGGQDIFNNKRYNGRIPSLSQRFQVTSKSPQNKDETLRSSFIPTELTHPFMDQAVQNVDQQSNRRSSNRERVNKNAGPTVGAINPLIYERVFNERLKDGKQNRKIQDNFEERIPSLSQRFQVTVENPQKIDETLGSSFIPTELTHPFMDQAVENFDQQSSRRSSNGDRANENAGPTVGAINPLIYERVFNERLDNSKQNKKSQDNFEGQLDGTKYDSSSGGDSSVSTIMKVQGQFLKPFMGQASKKNKHDFYGLFNPDDKKKEDLYEEPGYDYIELQSVNNKNK